MFIYSFCKDYLHCPFSCCLESSQLKERGYSETFSAAKEEQGEQLKEEISSSHSGIEGKMKTGNIEAR